MGTTQILADIVEYIRYPSGEVVREVNHHIAIRVQDKYVYMAKSKGTVSLSSLRAEAKKLITREIGTGHEFYANLKFFNPYTEDNAVYTVDYKPTKIKYEIPPEYRKAEKEGNSFDEMMRKGITSGKKAMGAINKGMDWFFMEGEYAKKKTPAKKTTAKSTSAKKTATTKKSTTNRKKATSSKPRQRAPSYDYRYEPEMMDFEPSPYYNDYYDYAPRNYRRY